MWRTFDFLWSLHIMDFKNHEDFNTPLLIISTALALVVIVTGIVMFPARLGYNRWRGRRRRARLVPREHLLPAVPMEQDRSIRLAAVALLHAR